MKLKTLVKLNEIREHPAKIYIHDTNSDEEFEMTVTEYLTYKNTEITDWVYALGKRDYGIDDVIRVWL